MSWSTYGEGSAFQAKNGDLKSFLYKLNPHPGALLPPWQDLQSKKFIMGQLEKLSERIVGKLNVRLKDPKFDAAAYLNYLHDYIPLRKLIKLYAICGIVPRHPFNFQSRHSNLSGSYFLGNCKVDNAMLYKSDIRGDELKLKGETVSCNGVDITLDVDEKIWIQDSILIKTLVHNCSHDPANPELFRINNTATAPYANIHGSPAEGCFLGPFATADLTRLHDCSLGAYSYVQTGELGKQQVGSGRIWIKAAGIFEFTYRYPQRVLDRYIRLRIGQEPTGILIDFMSERKEEFLQILNAVNLKTPAMVPRSSSLSRFAVVRPETQIGENVLVSQRAYLENSFLGKGANAQENCNIINSRLEGNNVMAHGAKIISARLARNVFVGFNSFLRGTPNCPLEIGKGCIVMPHTIIDLQEPLKIPADRLVWGYLQKPEDLKYHSLSLKKLANVRSQCVMKTMKFKGSGMAFVNAFRHRIQHILEANGAFYNGKKNQGHAQKEQHMSFNIIQPYLIGKRKGLFPTLDIKP